MKLISAAALLAGAVLASSAVAQDQPPQANPNAPANAALKAPHAQRSGAPAAGHTSFTRAEAKGRIEKAGYTHISRLNKTRQGLWWGYAEKDGRRVRVSVDYQGNVTSN